MTTKDQSEDEAAILTVWNDLTMHMCSGCERVLYQTLVDNMRAALTAARQDERRKVVEECARLHESINVACDHERPDIPGAGAMGAVIEFRDAIRALAPNPEESK